MSACGEVESTKSVSDIYAPVSGDRRRPNEALDGTPGAGQHRPLRRGLDVRGPARTTPAARRRTCSSPRTTGRSSAEPGATLIAATGPGRPGAGRSHPVDGRTDGRSEARQDGRIADRPSVRRDAGRGRRRSRRRRGPGGRAARRTPRSRWARVDARRRSRRRDRPDAGRPGRGRRPARRRRRCWSCSAARTPARGSCSTPSAPRPAAGRTATSSSTTSPSPASTPSSSGAASEFVGARRRQPQRHLRAAATGSTRPCCSDGDEVQIGKYRLVFHPSRRPRTTAGAPAVVSAGGRAPRATRPGRPSR